MGEDTGARGGVLVGLWTFSSGCFSFVSEVGKSHWLRGRMGEEMLQV